MNIIGNRLEMCALRVHSASRILIDEEINNLTKSYYDLTYTSLCCKTAPTNLSIDL